MVWPPIPLLHPFCSSQPWTGLVTIFHATCWGCWRTSHQISWSHPFQPPPPFSTPFCCKNSLKELSYTQYFHLLSSHSLLILLQSDSLPHHFRETTFLRPPVISTLPNPMVSSQVLLYSTSQQHSTQVITPSFLTNSSFHFWDTIFSRFCFYLTGSSFAISSSSSHPLNADWLQSSALRYFFSFFIVTPKISHRLP